MNILLQPKAPRLKVHTHQSSFFGSLLRGGRRTVKYLTVFVHDPRSRTSFFFSPFPKFYLDDPDLSPIQIFSTSWFQVPAPDGLSLPLPLSFQFLCLIMFLVSPQSDLVVSLKGTRGHGGPSETGDRKRGAGARGGDNRPFVEELSKPEVPSQQLALCTGNLGCRIVCCVCWRVGRVAFLFVNQFVSHSIKHSGQTG